MTPHFVLTVGGSRRGARNRFAEDLDRAEVNVSAGAMTAARHQIGEADFVDLAQIRIVDRPGDDDLFAKPDEFDPLAREDGDRPDDEVTELDDDDAALGESESEQEPDLRT